MTDRERWTVYPLLFLALGVAVKDKIAKFVSVSDVYCHRVIVTDREGREQVLITSSPSGGQVHVIENGGRDRLSIGGSSAGIERVFNGARSHSMFMQLQRGTPAEPAQQHEPEKPPAQE